MMENLKFPSSATLLACSSRAQHCGGGLSSSPAKDARAARLLERSEGNFRVDAEWWLKTGRSAGHVSQDQHGHRDHLGQHLKLGFFRRADREAFGCSNRAQARHRKLAADDDHD